MNLIISFISGSLFTIGLYISQMNRPQKVLHFLDIAGKWDPSLSFTMISAIAVMIFTHSLIKKKKNSLQQKTFSLPSKQKIDLPLILGASLFGVGWGLTGLCPGPALANLPKQTPSLLIFIFSMFLGILVIKFYQGRTSAFMDFNWIYRWLNPRSYRLRRRSHIDTSLHASRRNGSS